jgi:hypothetical protein
MKVVLRVCVNVELFDNWPFELKWPRNAGARTVILHFPAAVRSTALKGDLLQL